MSANNYLLISKSKFTVKECDADTDNCVVVKQGKSLEEAIELAETEMLKYMVEYGIHFEK